jgi:hypothetical protein
VEHPFLREMANGIIIFVLLGMGVIILLCLGTP